MPTWNSLGGEVELFAGVGVDGPGEAVLGVVGDGEGVGEVGGFDDGEDGAEDLFLRDAGGGGDVGEDGGLRCSSRGSGVFDGLAACEEAAFLLADFDVVEDALVGDRG